MIEEKLHLMIVDDQESIRKLCMTVGASLGLNCTQAESAEVALARLESEAPEMILADLMMPNMSGLDFLNEVKRMLPHTEIAIMTGHGSIETAVQAMRSGAYDYITKPFRIEELKLLLQRMQEKVELVTENLFLRERVNTEMDLSGIVGSSAKMISGRFASARATATRCCWPPESSDGRCRSRSPSRTVRTTVSSHSGSGLRRASDIGSVMFSSAFSVGTRL